MSQRPPIDLGELRAIVTSLERLIAEATRAATDLKAAIAAAEAYSDGPQNPGHSGSPHPIRLDPDAVQAVAEQRPTGARKAGPTPWSRRKSVAPEAQHTVRPEPQTSGAPARISAPVMPTAEIPVTSPPPVTQQPPPRAPHPTTSPDTPRPPAIHAGHDATDPATTEDTGPAARPQTEPPGTATVRPAPHNASQETPRPQACVPTAEIPRPHTDIQRPEPVRPQAHTGGEVTHRQGDVVTDSTTHRIAVEMANRHGLETIGFDEARIDTDVVREIAAAVDDMLTKYPIALCGIEITHPDGGGSPPAARGLSSSTARTEPEAIWLVLDRAAFVPLDRPDGNPLPLRWLRRGRDADRVVYTAVVREYGRALEVAGNFRARQEAQRLLIAESLHAGRGLTFSPLDPGRALLDAFTEVELRGDRAGKLAKALHGILVKMTRPESTDVPA